MATFLDVLSQNYSDQRGRFNPFAMAKGFSKEGRSKIDEEKKLGNITRQSQIGDVERRQQAIAGMGGMTIDSKPRTPEEAEVLRQLLQTESGKRAILGQDTSNEAAKFGLEQSRARAPIELDTARYNRDVSRDAAEVSGRTVGPRVLSSEMGAKGAESQARILQRQAEETPDPRVIEYINSTLASGEPLDSGQTAKMLGIEVPRASQGQGSDLKGLIEQAVKEGQAARSGLYKMPEKGTSVPATPVLPKGYGEAWQGQGRGAYSEIPRSESKGPVGAPRSTSRLKGAQLSAGFGEWDKAEKKETNKVDASPADFFQWLIQLLPDSARKIAAEGRIR